MLGGRHAPSFLQATLLPVDGSTASSTERAPAPPRAWRGTPAWFSELAQHFFCIGEQVERQPNLVREMVAAGHAVAVHGYGHRCHLRLTPRAVADDLARALDVIGCAAGHIVPFHRPPYGVYTLSSLIQMRRASLTPMVWSQWGRDWSRRATPRSVARRAGQDVGAGDVILLHDADHYGSLGCWRATVGALPMLIERIRNAGLELVALTAGD